MHLNFLAWNFSEEVLIGLLAELLDFRFIEMPHFDRDNVGDLDIVNFVKWFWFDDISIDPYRLEPQVLALDQLECTLKRDSPQI